MKPSSPHIPVPLGSVLRSCSASQPCLLSWDTQERSCSLDFPMDGLWPSSVPWALKPHLNIEQRWPLLESDGKHL